MLFKRLVEVGRVCYIAEGQDAGKTCAIVDIIDQNKVLVDGPASGVNRQAIRLNEMHLTDYVIKIQRSTSTKAVRQAWEADKINDKWNASNWAKRIAARAKHHPPSDKFRKASDKIRFSQRANMTDFDRFKLQKAKQSRNGILRQALVASKLKTSKNKAVLRSRARVQKLKAKVAKSDFVVDF